MNIRLTGPIERKIEMDGFTRTVEEEYTISLRIDRKDPAAVARVFGQQAKNVLAAELGGEVRGDKVEFEDRDYRVVRAGDFHQQETDGDWEIKMTLPNDDTVYRAAKYRADNRSNPTSPIEVLHDWARYQSSDERSGPIVELLTHMMFKMLGRDRALEMEWPDEFSGFGDYDEPWL